MKDTYVRSEIPCANFLMTFQQGLLNDYMTHQESVSSPKYKDFVLRYKDCRTDIAEEELAKMFLTKKNGEWVNDADIGFGVGIKYDYQKYSVLCRSPDDLRKIYPTAMQIMDAYGDSCTNAIYTVMPPQSVFVTHIDGELTGRNLIRLHIPLVIPEGEVYMQFGDEKVYWKDFVGFNGLAMHSAHNLTDEWGLIFLMDLDARVAGIEK